MNQPYNMQTGPGPSYGGYPPPPRYHQYMLHRKPIRKWSNIIGGGMLIRIGVVFALSFLLYGAFAFLDFSEVGPAAYDLVDQSLQLIIYVLSFWIPTVFIMMKISIPPAAAFPLRLPRPGLLVPAVFVTLGASIVGGLLSGIVSVTVETVTGLTPYMPDMPMPHGIGANIVYFISLAVAPAIFEELLFRGVVMQSLRQFGDGFALVMSAVMFSLMHGNLIQGPNTLLVGLVMGYFVLRTGSLLTSIIIHFVNNGLIVIYTYLEPVMTVSQYETLNMWVFGAYLLLGVASLVFLHVRYGNLFRVAPSTYPLTSGQKTSALSLTVPMIAFLVISVVQTLLYLE